MKFTPFARKGLNRFSSSRYERSSRFFSTFLIVIFMLSTLFGNGSAASYSKPQSESTLNKAIKENLTQNNNADKTIQTEGLLLSPEIGSLSEKIYLKKMTPPSSTENRKMFYTYEYSPAYCPSGNGYCYTSLSGYTSIKSFQNTYNVSRALAPGGDCVYGSGNYTNVLAPGDGGEAWVIFDLGEVFSISKFISWDLHHGWWWLDYSADGTTWSSFASGRTYWFDERCTSYQFDRSSSPVSVRYIRYKIKQETWVGDAYRIAWFSFLTNTPSKLHPTIQYETIQSSGTTKCGSKDPRECKIANNKSNLVAYAADPVNTLTGGYDYSVGDLAIPTAAGPMVFQRSYSSSAVGLNLYTPGIDTSLGYGWTHNQDIRLFFPQPDQVKFKAQSANQYQFTKNPDGSYTPYTGVTASLNYNPSTSQYTLIDSGQNVYIFDSGGKILSWKNEIGLAFTYTYNNGLLSRVTGPDGNRYINFSYTNGLLTSVNDHSGRSLSYSYNGNDLTTFTNELGATWNYSYDASHRLTSVSITDQNDPTRHDTLVRNLYDNNGRVVCQQEGDEYPPIVQYEVINNPIICTNIGTDVQVCRPEGGKIVKCKQANGSETVATAIAYNDDGTTTVKNGLGEISSQSYNKNTNTLYEQSDALGNTTNQQLDANLRPQTIIDPANHATHMVWSQDGTNLNSITDALNNTFSLEWDSRNSLTQITNPDNTISRFIYNTSNATDPFTGASIYNPNWDEDLLLMQVLNYKPNSTESDANLVTYYSYTSTNDAPEPPNLLRKVDPPGPDTCYLYDFLGQQIKVFENCVDMNPETGESGEDLIRQTNYDVLGRVETITDTQGKITQYKYYNLDDQVDEIIQNYDPIKAPYEEGLWNIATLYNYDSRGKVINVINNAINGDLDGNGIIEPALTLDLNQDGTPEYSLEIDPNKPGFNIISSTSYDTLDRVKESIRNAWPGKPPYYLNLYNLSTRTFYDHAGRTVATITNYSSSNLPGWGEPIAIDFDEDSIIDATLEINPDFPEFNQITRTNYDKAGQVSTTTQAAWPNQNDYYQPEGSSSVYNLVSANEYDATGNITKTIANYDVDLVDSDSDGFTVNVSLNGSLTTITIDPDTPDRNQITCISYDALNRPEFTRTACVPGQSDYKKAENNLYNIVAYNIYDPMGQQIASIRNYYDPDGDGVLEFSSQNNFITRNYFDDLGRIAYTANNFVGNIDNPAPPIYNPAIPDRNLITRFYYDTNGRQYATVQNYWEPTETIDGLLTQLEIEAGLPDKNRISRSYFNPKGQVIYTVQNFVGNLLSSDIPEYNNAFPDRNLVSESVYDANGQLIASIDPGGVITRTYFDALNRPYQIIQNLVDANAPTIEALISSPIPPSFNSEYPDQNISNTTIYNSTGNAIAAINNAGVISRTYFDALNRTTAFVQNLSGQTIDADTPPNYDPTYPDRNLLTETEYNIARNIIRSTDQEGIVTQFCYDSQFRTYKTIINPTVDNPCLEYSSNSPTDYDQTTRTTYDLSGNRLSAIDPTGKVTEYGYDNLGRLTSKIDMLHNITRYNYDTAGNQIDLINANQVTTHYEYDGFGHLTAVIENYQPNINPTQDINVRTEYRYDAAGNLIYILNGLGHYTYFSYDALGRLLSEEDALGNITTYQYDKAGNHISLTDGNSTTTNYIYDDLNRLIGIDYPAPDADVSFSYNSIGSRKTMEDGVGITTWNYDEIGRQISIQDPYNQTVEFGYNATGKRTSLVYPTNQTVNYEYDSANRLTRVTDWAGLSTEYIYDTANRLTGMLLPNGIQASYQYDDAGRLEDIAYVKDQNLISQYQYALDPIGNRTHVKESTQLRGRPLPVVEVTVTDTAGQPIEGVTVIAVDGNIETSFTAITDNNGIARLSIETPGSYRFQVNHNGGSFYSRDVDHCLVPGCTYAFIRLPRLTGTIITASGDPAPGMEVIVYSDTGPTDIQGITNMDGQVTLLVPDGCYRLHTEKIGFRAYSPRVCTIPGQGATTLINLADAVHSTITAMDDAGNPQSNVPIYFYAGEVYTGKNGITGTDGKLTIDLPEDKYRFAPAAPGDTLPPETQITVNVQGTNGENRVGAKVYALSGSDTNEYKIFTGRISTTDANGQATFSLPQVGKYRFRIEEENLVYYSSLSNLCDPTTCTSILITAPTMGGNITITVFDQLAHPVSDAMVFVYDGDQYTGLHGLTDENGQTILTLPQGNFHFRADINGKSIFSQPVNHCSPPSCASAEIRPLDTIPVTVTENGEGSPQPNVTVYVFSGNTYENMKYAGYSGKTDQQGQVAFNLPPGTYWFTYKQGSMAMDSGEPVACVVPGCTGLTISTFQGKEIAYTYDPLNRLTQTNYSDGLFFHYSYDAVGNRLSETTPFGTTSYTYDDANRLSSVGNINYTWDNNGNLLSDGVSNYTFDAANRLKTVTTSAGIFSYTYNGLGDRLSQTANGLTTQYTLDLAGGLTQVLAENTPQGNVTNTYLYGRERIAQANASGMEYFLGDGLGSVRQMTNASGGLTLTRSYEPYGDILDTSGSGASSYGFTGEWTDATGLVNLRARYYAPLNGRFLTRDSWRGNYTTPMSYNAWLYVYANPINYLDPSGRCADEDGDNICEVFPPYSNYANFLREYRKNYKPEQEPPFIYWKTNTYAEKIAKNKAPIFNGEEFEMDNEQAQFHIEGHKWKCDYKKDGNGTWYCPTETICNQNFCGQVVISALLRAAGNHSITAKDVIEDLAPTHSGCEGTGYTEIRDFINEQYSDSLLAKYISGVYTSSQLPTFIKIELENNRVVFPAVSLISGSYNRIGAGGASIGHWVLITGISYQWNYNDDLSELNWVRVFNPYDNRTEYYWWEDFRSAWHEDSAAYDTLTVHFK